MTDLFWTVATSYVALSVIGVVALAALIVGHIPFGSYAPMIAPYVVLARVVSYPALMLLALLIGFRISDEHAALAQLKQDLAFTQHQLSIQKQTADDADRLRREAAEKLATSNQKVDAYEKQLKALPAGNNCDLDDNDVRSLRDIAR